jgi:outer membrane protein assembly factor BamB
MRIPVFLPINALAVAAASIAADDGWPRWRGPFENGMARGDAPVTFSDKDRVAWKATIPGRGHSTPVVWADRIFLTTAVPTGAAPASAAATQPAPAPGGGRARGGPGGGGGPQGEQKLMVMAFDRKTGKLLWEKVARTATPHEGYHSQYGSFASNSPVVDARHLIAFFGSRGVYCYTHDGQLVWEKDFGVQMRMLMSFGEGVAPALDGDRLFLLYDHEGDSFVVALDKNTGKELWRTPRPPGSAWSGPLITTVNGKKQLIIPATKFTAGYDVETGKVIWQVNGLGRNVIPMTTVADGTAYVMSGYQQPNLMAIRLGREGDLTGTDAVLWQNQRGNSYTPSPVLHEGKFYFLTDNGTLSCFEAKTGKPFYAQERLPKPYSFKASPVGANGKLYLASEDGDVIVVKMGEKFEVLATNTFDGQMFIASPVILDNEIYLRGQNTLFCVR